MILPDTNLWLALTLSKHTHHQAAVSWLDGQSVQNSIAFCRSTQQSFLRLMTTTNVMAVYGNEALSNAAAWSCYEAFMADDRIIFLPEPTGIDLVWKKLAARKSCSPKLWMDSYLAAFAMAGGMELTTIDKAFTLFPGLDVVVVDSG